MTHERATEFLRFNAAMLWEELKQRGGTLEPLDETSQTLVATLAGRTEFLLRTDGGCFTHPAATVANHKMLSKLALKRAGVPVPEGRRFGPSQSGDAMMYGRSLGYPVVVKPCSGASGLGVHINLTSMDEVDHAFDDVVRLFGWTAEVLVEKQVPGSEFRVFIAADGRYAAVHRDPAHVFGNGTYTIQELAEQETYRRITPRTNCLCPIELDETVNQHLGRQGLGLGSIPAEGQKVYLRSNSNVKHGATCVDVTDTLHPSVAQVCWNALRSIPGMPYVGVDFMTTAHDVDQAGVPHHVVELNTDPSIGMHLKPSGGAGRNIASVMADYIFPETRTADATPQLRKIGAVP